MDPNAVCPVCGQEVFFYSNSFGSRVFFDELGKPWTKHPCTDNAPAQTSEEIVRPVRRSTGEIGRILEAEKTTGKSFLPSSRKARKQVWKLAHVVEVNFSGLAMSVVLEDLTGSGHRKIDFQVFCEDQLLNVGDLISWRGATFSFLHPKTLESMDVENGAILLDLDALDQGISHSTIPSQLTDMVVDERRHFSGLNDVGRTISDELRPVLEDFAKKRIVGPKLVSHYLNATGRKTADGWPWTPRLAFFLILLTGVEQKPASRSKSAPVKAQHRGANKNIKSKKVWKNKSQRKNNTRGFAQTGNRRATKPKLLSENVEDWAEMLSQLGRVTRKTKDN